MKIKRKPDGSDQLNKLLQVIAQRMDTTPENLIKSAQDGTLAELLNGSDEDIRAFEVILSDPAIAKKLLSPEQATALITYFENEK